MFNRTNTLTLKGLEVILLRLIYKNFTEETVLWSQIKIVFYQKVEIYLGEENYL